MNINVSVSDTEKEKAETLKRNIEFFCRTPKGSLPQMRDFGLDYSILDRPFGEMRMYATVDIITGIRKYYEIQITDINVTAETDGSVNINIKI